MIEQIADSYIEELVEREIDDSQIDYEESNYEAGRNNALITFGKQIFKAGAKWQKNNLWIKIEEGCSLPKDGMPILVRRYYRNKYGRFTTRVTQETFFECFGFDAFCCKSCNERITHWMPIPKLP